MEEYKNFENFIIWIQGRCYNTKDICSIYLKQQENLKGTGKCFERIYTLDGKKFSEICSIDSGSEIKEECLSIGIENIKKSLEGLFEVNNLSVSKNQANLEISPSKELKKFVSKNSIGNFYFPNSKSTYKLKN